MDLAIAVWLALFPLLPAGPTYFNRDWPWALEGFFLALLGGGLLVLLVGERASATSASLPRSVQLIRRGYLIWLVPVAAATILGLLDRMPFDLMFWRVEAQGLVGRLARPMDQAVDPWYPLRVGLIYLEGGLMFCLLSSLLSRTGHAGRRARTALIGCLAGTALVSVVAIVQYVTGANLHEYWVRMNPDLTRSHATLDDPNALASYLVLGIGVGSGVAWSVADRAWRRGAVLVTVLAVFALITTVSRAGWAGLLLAVLVCAAWLPVPAIGRAWAGPLVRNTARVAMLLLCVAVAAWVAAAAVLPTRPVSPVPTTPWEAVLQTVDPREPVETILKRRHLLWLAGLDLVKMHDGLGAGLGQFPRFLASYPGSDGPENAHNFFLQVLAEVGIAGLASLAILLAAIALAVGHRIRGQTPNELRLTAGLAIGVMAFVLTWLTGHPLLNLSNQLWFASVLAVGLMARDAAQVHGSPTGAVSARSDASNQGPGSWLGHRAVVPLALGVTLVAVTPRVVATARKPLPAEHAAGVYAWEAAPVTDDAPADARFRWTRRRAVIRESIQGKVIVVPLYVARPVPVELQMTFAGVPTPAITLMTTGWQRLTFDLASLLGESGTQAGRTLTIELMIEPVFVPSSVNGSDDRRELGVGLGTIGWDSSGRRD